MIEKATQRRRQLGEGLRQARLAAGLTQAQAAAALAVSQGKIHKIEQSLMSIRLSELEHLIRLYEIPAEWAESLLKLAQLDSGEVLGRTAWSAYQAMLELEERASSILSWHSERIPNILQAESYMLSQAQALQIDSANIGNLTRHRVERQKIFAKSDPPIYREILSESSLYRMPGGQAAVALDQCYFLLGLMERFERVEVQVLTFTANVPYVDSDFVLLHSEGSGEWSAYVEYIGDSRIVKKRRELNQMREYWDVLQRAALSREETIKYLRDFISRL